MRIKDIIDDIGSVYFGISLLLYQYTKMVDFSAEWTQIGVQNMYITIISYNIEVMNLVTYGGSERSMDTPISELEISVRNFDELFQALC